jgi:hypothetical protein
MDSAITFITELLRDGNYLGALIIGITAFGGWWMWRFDKRNSAEHNELATKMIEKFAELEGKFKEDLSKEAKGLGRSIDRVEDAANRVESKIDEHIADHARGDV